MLKQEDNSNTKTNNYFDTRKCSYRASGEQQLIQLLIILHKSNIFFSSAKVIAIILHVESQIVQEWA